MFKQPRAAITLLIAFTLLTGVLYPLAVTFVAQTVFPIAANGSLIQVGDETVGSALIGQSFTQDKYFWGRLSATGPTPYNAAASSGSNYGPLHADLKITAEMRIAALKAGSSSSEKIPVDLVTASGSGLDPHISPAAAEYQIPRVAAARKMSESALRELVAKHTEGRFLGLLGEPRVNVLQLNLALDGK